MRWPGQQQGRTRISTLSFRQRQPGFLRGPLRLGKRPRQDRGTRRRSDRDAGLTGDFCGSRAEQDGYVNRVVADEKVDRIASRLARFDHDAIARTKSYADRVTLPGGSELPPTVADWTGHGRGQPATRRPARGPPP